MSVHITLIGTVATEPKIIRFENGGSKCSFRFAESERRFDRTTGTWLESEANWYTVNVSRGMGDHAAESLRKGQRIIVTGRARVRQWTTADGRSGSATEVEADGIGHDLRFGVSMFEPRTGAKAQRADTAEQSGISGQSDAQTRSAAATGEGLQWQGAASAAASPWQQAAAETAQKTDTADKRQKAA